MLSSIESLACCFIDNLFLLLLLFFSWKWFLPARRTVTLPEPVTLKRLAADCKDTYRRQISSVAESLIHLPYIGKRRTFLVFNFPPRRPSAHSTSTTVATALREDTKAQVVSRGATPAIPFFFDERLWSAKL